MFGVLYILIATLLLFNVTLAAAPTELLFLIACGESDYHRRLSARLHNDIIEQSQSLPSSDYIINIRIVHEIFKAPGHWTLLNVLSQLTHLQDDNGAPILDAHTQWIVWCEESTHVRLLPLVQQLALEDPTQAFYLGHALHDHEATIIHHFAFFENPQWFPYPMTRAGVIFSRALLQSIAAATAEEATANTWQRGAGMTSSGNRPRRHTDFSIDAAHELARFIYDNVPKMPTATHTEVNKAVAAVEGDGNGDGDIDVIAQQRNSNVDNAAATGDNDVRPEGYTRKRQHGDTDNEDNHEVGVHTMPTFKTQQKVILRKASYICPRALQVAGGDAPMCALHAQPLDMSECPPVQRQQLYFAVKTCAKYHKERLPIIAATWAQFAANIRYYSDVADDVVPTTSSGVPNVETGHCAKTLAILKLAFKDIEQLNRQMDTNSRSGRIHWLVLTDDDTILSVANIAQLLGCFNHTHEIYLGERYGYRLHAVDGFNYITGGGGIALSLPTVALILQHCSCPSALAPDDMILGACLHTLQVPAIHSARFHQARPSDYARTLLALERPISFHKFWQLDPLVVYERFFAAADRHLLRLEQQQFPLRRRPLQPHSDVGNTSAQQRAQLLSNCQQLSTADAKQFDGVHCRRKLTKQTLAKDNYLEL